MTIVYAWPNALRPLSVEWALAVPQWTARSAFDGSAFASTVGAPRWAFNLETGVITRAEVPVWEALIDRLDGMVNRLSVWDFRRETPLGVATGTPLVRVAGAGNTLQTKGWTASTTGILLAGSYFSVNGELKRLSVDLDSDASGHGTAEFRPPLRATAPVDAPLLLVKPTAKFYLVTQRPYMRQVGARHPGWNLGFEEDPS